MGVGDAFSVTLHDHFRTSAVINKGHEFAQILSFLMLKTDEIPE